MDLKKILEGVENQEEIIKQIETEVGRSFVPRSEFNEKISNAKSLERQLAELTANFEGLSKEKAEHANIIAELNQKLTTAEASAIRSKVAYELGLPIEIAGRLVGETEEAIRDDASKISALIGKQNIPPLKSVEPTINGADAPYKQLLQKLKGE